jgi:carbamoyl-phosphate synthase small subunit
MKMAFLVLESGEIFPGRWLGGADRAGEVVFNTSHSGYEEIATDPSYLSQIVVMTAPMQGNYGISDQVWESRQIWIEGFVALQIENSDRDGSWKRRLVENGIPCVSEIDTRAVALRLRSGGTSWGALIQADSEVEAKKKAQNLIEAKKVMEKDWVWLASRKKIEKRSGNHAQGPRIAVLDFGSKENIIRELARLCREVVIYPSRTPIADILACQPDGIMLTNGPGDPADVQVATGTVRELIGQIPVFGICMGHQILGLALGAKTYKLKFGHRGSNHPIRDSLLSKVYMSSQNHGYAVDGATLPKDIQVTHTNLNDNTVAGYYSQERLCLGIQYHPESHPGPHEAAGLFDFFINNMVMKRKK